MTSEHQQDQHEGAQALAPETGRATATAGETAAEAVRETGTAAAPDAAPTVNGQITEDEASLYDRQIRLWGLEAQNRMRNSTVLVLSLRALAHEVIKNLVLAGIGRLIVMDGDAVTEDDLGAGFLFREEDGAVGQNIASLNPLVSLTAIPSLEPFVPSAGAPAPAAAAAMAAFLAKEKVDVVVACDLSWPQLGAIDDAARTAGAIFYGAGTYGFYGYAFADLGDAYDFVVTPAPTPGMPAAGLQKKTLSYAPLAAVLNRSEWALPHPERIHGSSPFRGLTRSMTRGQQPGLTLALLALWVYESEHGTLPTGGDVATNALASIAEQLRKDLGVNDKALPAVDAGLIAHLAAHANHFFPPTLAIVGGILAQDVLRALSRKDMPIANLLAVDSTGGIGVVSRWAMGDAENATGDPSAAATAAAAATGATEA